MKTADSLAIHNHSWWAPTWVVTKRPCVLQLMKQTSGEEEVGQRATVSHLQGQVGGEVQLLLLRVGLFFYLLLGPYVQFILRIWDCNRQVTEGKRKMRSQTQLGCPLLV